MAILLTGWRSGRGRPTVTLPLPPALAHLAWHLILLSTGCPIKSFLVQVAEGGGHLESWWNFCTQEGSRGLVEENLVLEAESIMPSPPPIVREAG